MSAGPGSVSDSPAPQPFHAAQEPLRGIACSLEELTAARFAARQISLPQLRRALARQQGVARSAARGRGLEFEEVRAYQAGDDVRTIDWRVTARSDRPFTRLFREERERPVLLAVDQRRAMFFGSRTCFKAKLAAWLGAALGWAALNQGDRIGGVIFGDAEQHDIRPRRSRRTMTAWLQALHAYNQRPPQATAELPDASASLDAALRSLERVVRPGTTTLLVSDLAGAEPRALAERLHRLARHGDVTVCWTVDPLERELPPPGLYPVADGDRQLLLDSRDAGLRAAFHDRFVARQQALAAALGEAAIPLLLADTAAPPLQALAPSARLRAQRAGARP